MSLAGSMQKAQFTEYIMLYNYKKDNNLDNYNLTFIGDNYVLEPIVSSDCANLDSLKGTGFKVENGVVVNFSKNLENIQSPLDCAQAWHDFGPGTPCCPGCIKSSDSAATGMCKPPPPHGDWTTCDGSKPGAPTPSPITPGNLYKGSPYIFPTHRNPYQKVRWLYTCTGGQGQACVLGSATPEVSDLKNNGINYISLITGLPTGNADVFNACAGDSTTFLIDQTDTKCGTECFSPATGAVQDDKCLTVGQGWVKLPYTTAQILEAHEWGISISLVLGSWNMIFPNDFTLKSKDIATMADEHQYAATLYSRFMMLRNKLGNCIDGIDFDWEGFGIHTCTYGDGCKDNGWDSNCKDNGSGKTKSGADCFKLADNTTIRYINAIAAIFKDNPLGKDHSAKSYGNASLLTQNLWKSDSPPNFGAEGPLSVTVVPMSSQMFSSIATTNFNGQNQYRGLDHTKIDALLLQWYSGFDGGATADVDPKWRPNWLDSTAMSDVSYARGCSTNMRSGGKVADLLPDKINSSIVAGTSTNYISTPQRIPAPSKDSDGNTTISEYETWIQKYYANNEGNARCKATSQLKDGPGEYSARCPRRLDCPDWWYNDDQFAHQSQLYLLAQFKKLGWDLQTQLIVGLEFFNTGVDQSPKWDVPHKYGSQWGPVPDVYWVLGLDAALQGPEEYKNYYDFASIPSNLETYYIDTFKQVGLGDDVTQLSKQGLGGIGGWTLAGAIEVKAGSNIVPLWSGFLNRLCTDPKTQPWYPPCGKPIPDPSNGGPISGSSGEVYYPIDYKYI